MFFMPVALALLLQLDLDYELLAVEDARGDATRLIEALSSPDPDIQVQAVRTLGRFERPALAEHVVPLLDANAAELRIEAANALGQMKASGASVSARLKKETAPQVRAALFESLGRFPDTRESMLLRGFKEQEPVRLGAVKGLESFLRTRNVARRVIRETRWRGGEPERSRPHSQGRLCSRLHRIPEGVPEDAASGRATSRVFDR